VIAVLTSDPALVTDELSQWAMEHVLEGESGLLWLFEVMLEISAMTLNAVQDPKR
jgi:hypothetical protein